MRKHTVGVERGPEDQQKKRFQNHRQLSLGSFPPRQGGDNRYKRHDMKEEQRIGNRVLRNLDVQTKFVVKLNVLIQCPQTVSGGKEVPECPTSKRVLDSISDS